MIESAGDLDRHHVKRGLSDLTDAVAVERALDEFDQLGRAAFPAKYGYGPARSRSSRCVARKGCWIHARFPGRRPRQPLNQLRNVGAGPAPVVMARSRLPQV